MIRLKGALYNTLEPVEGFENTEKPSTLAKTVPTSKKILLCSVWDVRLQIT